MKPQNLAIAAGDASATCEFAVVNAGSVIGNAHIRRPSQNGLHRAADQSGVHHLHLVAADGRDAQPLAAQIPFASAVLIRLFDIVSATMLLIALLPFLVLLAIVLQIDSPGRLFFVQQRVGRGGRMFGCIKFRTMCEDADLVLKTYLAENAEARAEWDRDFKLANDPRVTRLGKLVRRFSMDEFPQLLNIIRGDMSVVGPRPIIRAEIERYGRHFAHYISVRPGLTGLWQVSGRNDISYAERVALDCRYVASKSLKTDLSIILRTIPAIIFAKGAY